MNFEATLIYFLQNNATPFWVAFFRIVSLFGGYLSGLITFLIVFHKNKQRGALFAIAFVGAGFLNYILKRIIQRSRPFDVYNFIQNLGGEDGFSMPSGHSVCAGTIAVFLFYHILKECKQSGLRWLIGVNIVLYSHLIMFSRIFLGAHFLTDTIVGIIIGITFAILVICVYNICRRKIWKGASYKKDGTNFFSNHQE